MDRRFNSCNDPELWGGIECTINRVGDDFRDQLALTGHYDRPDDIARFAALGLKRMRYPVLWERHAPVKDMRIDWTHTAQNLGLLAEYDIEPIAGLIHHGSGPAYTSLLDPDFSARLAAYAFEVASRFPELKQYTPVNEPLTTARFSGLYGLWYPHHSCDGSFVRMLLNQLKGTVLSMQAIRAVNPAAQLVQTEDLGKTHSTPELAGQADFENERRWLTFDILTGCFQPGHPLWHWFTADLGIKESELRFFQDNPTPPDLLGLNYYVTSERWLDQDLSRFPSATHGGNDRQSYADTEVVRVQPANRLGIKNLGAEVWERYGIPLALTEVHLHCTREEQLRWFMEVWRDAVALCRENIPVTAVTVWSLLGAYDWDSLLTKPAHHYESGVFALDNGVPRETALALILNQLENGTGPQHPLLQTKGWWHGRPLTTAPDSECLSLLLLGGEGELSNALADACESRGISYSLILRTANSEKLLSEIESFPAHWAQLRFTDENSMHFYSGGFRASANPGTALVPLVNQILDLVIDAATGTWLADQTGKLSRTSGTIERAASFPEREAISSIAK